MSEPGSQSVEKAVAKHALIKRDAEVVELRFEAVLCRQAGGGQKPLLADRFDHRRIDERVANTPSSSGSLAYGLFLTSVLLSSMRLNPPDYLHVAVSIQALLCGCVFRIQGNFELAVFAFNFSDGMYFHLAHSKPPYVLDCISSTAR